MGVRARCGSTVSRSGFLPGLRVPSAEVTWAGQRVGARVSSGPPPPLTLVRTPLSCSVSTAGLYSRRSGRTPSTPRPSSSDCGPDRGGLTMQPCSLRSLCGRRRWSASGGDPASLSAQHSPGDAAHQAPVRQATLRLCVLYSSLDQQHSFLVNTWNSILWHRNDCFSDRVAVHTGTGRPRMTREMGLPFPGKGT